MSQELINSICDLKKKQAESRSKMIEVKVRHPHPAELLDDIIQEIDSDRFEGRFENREHLMHYLRYLLDTRHRGQHERTFERDYRHVRCDCGTVFKITIEPAPREFIDLSCVIEERIYDYWCRFFCSTCRMELRTNAKRICRIETEEVEEYVDRLNDKRGKYINWEL